MHRCSAVRLPLPNLNLVSTKRYYSMFMGGCSFDFHGVFLGRAWKGKIYPIAHILC